MDIHAIPSAATTAALGAKEGASFPKKALCIDPKLEAAAQEFEAVMLRQLLTSALGKSFGGGLFDGSSESTRSIQSALVVDALSQTLSKQNMLGFSTLLQTSLHSAGQ